MAVLERYAASVLAFGALYLAHCRLLTRTWPERFAANRGATWTSAERCCGVWHSSATVALSAFGLWQSWARHGWFQYDAPNAAVLELSMLITLGYFTVDTASMLASWALEGAPFPLTFLLHHFACVAYVTSCLALGIGAETAAVATVVGEVTNPMQNAWFLSKDVGRLDIHAALSPAFTWFFVVVRCVLTPLWSADVVWFCAFRPNGFGAWGPVFAALCVLVNIGGMLWAQKLWQGRARFLAKQKLAQAAKAD